MLVTNCQETKILDYGQGAEGGLVFCEYFDNNRPMRLRTSQTLYSHRLIFINKFRRKELPLHICSVTFILNIRLKRVNK